MADIKAGIAPVQLAAIGLFFGCAWLGMKSSLSLAVSIECDQTKFACRRESAPAADAQTGLQRVVNRTRRGFFLVDIEEIGERVRGTLKFTPSGPSKPPIGQLGAVTPKHCPPGRRGSNAVICAWLGWLMSRKRKSLVPFASYVSDLKDGLDPTCCCTFRLKF